jgi:hypothetical protein
MNTNFIHSVLKNSIRAEIEPFKWTFFHKNGTDAVVYVSSRSGHHYETIKVKKFLGFEIGREGHVVKKADVSVLDWYELDDVLHNCMIRLGVIK